MIIQALEDGIPNEYVDHSRIKLFVCSCNAAIENDCAILCNEEFGNLILLVAKVQEIYDLCPVVIVYCLAGDNDTGNRIDAVICQDE